MHAYKHTYIRTYIHTHIYIHMYVHTRGGTIQSAGVSMHHGSTIVGFIFMYTDMYLYIITVMYIHTHTSTCMYVCMLVSIADDKAYKKFSEDDVEGSFLYLLSELEALWSKADLSELKKICKRDNRLSNELRSDVRKAPDLEETFDLLATSPFCTWLELRILKRMAKVANVPEAMDMIKVFEECVHKRKCSEVKPYFKKQYINPDHLTLVTAKLNQNPDNLIVSDLINYCHKLEGICGIPAESSTPISSKEGCLEISFAIPTYCCLHAYEIAKSNFFQLRPIHIQYLQIGMFPRIYAVGQEISTDDSFLKWISSSFDKCKFIDKYI